MSLDDLDELQRFTDDLWEAIKPALKGGHVSGEVGTKLLLVAATWLSVSAELSVGEFLAQVGDAYDAVQRKRREGGSGPGGLH